MRKKLLSLLLTFCLCIGYIPAVAYAAESPISKGSNEYKELEKFLAVFAWWGRETTYDAQVENNVSFNGLSLLEGMLSEAPCYPDSSYPGPLREDVWSFEGKKADPLGKLDSYAKISVAKVDWILENIFNCSASNIAKMKAALNREGTYIYDGFYYTGIGGIGGGFDVDIKNIALSAQRYYVTYDLKSAYEENWTRYGAVFEWKNIDGKNYWSLYSNKKGSAVVVEDNPNKCGDNVTWTLENGTLTISGTGPMDDFNPYNYSSTPASPWNDIRNRISRIVINNGVTSIGEYAFWRCESLTSVSISNSVTKIGDNAFWSCEKLTSVSIPSSVTYIGKYAFQGSGLTTVTVPSSVGTVSDGLFAECPNLTSAIIAEGVTRIETAPFYECFEMTSVSIPKSLIYLNGTAFDRCLSLRDIYYGGSKSDWEKIDTYHIADIYTMHYSNTPAANPSTSTKNATPTASTVLVNGVRKSFDAYNINGSNYFKLRDLAYVLSGTEKQFEVGWDNAAKAISLTSGEAYTTVGGEMTGKGSGTQTANPSSAKIVLNGEEIALTAYEIGGNNYFKLRDIGEIFDFGIGWDNASKTITIDTSTGYTAE